MRGEASALASARSLGACIVRYDRLTDDRDVITDVLAAEYTIVPSADDKAVMAGAGTASPELLHQAPGLSVILVPVGGGSLAVQLTTAPSGPSQSDSPMRWT